MNLSYITPQLVPVTELPVVPTCVAFVICMALMYLVGHLEGWRDCAAQGETWESRRQAKQEHTAMINLRRSAVLPFNQRDASRRRLKIRLVKQPRRRVA